MAYRNNIILIIIMESKQSDSVNTTHNTVFTDISLTNIATNFKSSYMRNRGTLGQLVYSLDDMVSRLNEPSNEYQSSMYPKIQSECKNIVSEYNRLVNTIQSEDYYVAGYYLNGRMNNGKRKATTTQYEKKSYSVSEYKETLKSINDRLRHIKYDCLRKARDTTRTNHEVFQRMVVFCDEYYQVILGRLDEWNTFITELRNTNGISKKTRVVKRNSRNQKNQLSSDSRNTNTNHLDNKIRVRRKQNGNSNRNSNNQTN